MLVLCVSLTERREAQIAGQTWFLGVPVGVSLEELALEVVDWVK